MYCSPLVKCLWCALYVRSFDIFPMRLVLDTSSLPCSILVENSIV